MEQEGPGMKHKPFPDGEFTEQELKEIGNCNALTNQEAKIVLKRFLDANLKAHKMWTPPALAQKAMEYLEKVERKTDLKHSDSVARIRDMVQSANMYEFEMALLANLTPDTAEEAMALVPSLQDGRFEGENKQMLQNALEEILTLKQLQ